MKTKPMLYLLHLLVALWLALPFTTHAAPSVEVLGYSFGVFTEEDESFNFQPTPEVPLVKGQLFGWVVRLKTDDEEVPVVEEHKLSGPSPEWPDPEDMDVTISEDRSGCIHRFNAVPDEDGMIMNIWEVAEGDPAGVGCFTLKLAGKTVRLPFILVEASEMEPDAPGNHSSTKPYVPEELTSQRASMQKLAAEAAKYLAELNTAQAFTNLRISAARKEGEQAEIEKSERHLRTLEEEQKNMLTGATLLHTAIKEIEEAIRRREAVKEKQGEKAVPTSTSETPEERPSKPRNRKQNRASDDRAKPLQARLSEKNLRPA
jgi:hypothetical protein